VNPLGNFPCYLAQSKRYLIGSAPIESTKMIGVDSEESSKADSKSKAVETINRLSNDFTM